MTEDRTSGRPRSLLASILAILFALGLPNAADARTVYVGPTGSNANPGTREQPWATPAYGAQQLQPGDTLIILGGRYLLSTYPDDIIVPPSGTAGAWVTIRGEPGSRPTLAGRANLLTGMDLSGTSYVRIENLEITHDDQATGNNIWFRDGISIVGQPASHIVLQDLYVHHLDEFGLDVGDVDDLQVINSRFEYCGFGGAGGPAGEHGGWRNVLIQQCRLAYSGHYYRGGNGSARPYDRPDGLGSEASAGPVEIVDTVAEHNYGDGLDSKCARTTIRRSVVANNSCDGVKLWSGGSRVENTLIYGRGDGDPTETPWAPIVLSTDVANDSFELVNVSVDDALGRNYLMYTNYDSPTVGLQLLMRNCIFRGSGPSSAIWINGATSLTADHNLFYLPSNADVLIHGGTTYASSNIASLGTGNIYGNPLFVKTAWGSDGDYHLQAGSPAINRGSTVGAPTVDLENRGRDAQPDIGAYEYAGSPTCTYTLSASSQPFAAGGGTGTVGVTAGTGCAWTASSNVSWVTVTAGTSGTGSGTVSFTVAANSTTTARSGTLTIGRQTFTVTQMGAALSYTLTVVVVGNGTAASNPAGISCGASCTSAYASGTIVTLTATPGSGSVFGGWTGDPECLTGAVIMNNNRACQATFLTRVPAGPAGNPIDLNGDGAGDVVRYRSTTGDWSMDVSNRQGTFGSRTGRWSPDWQIYPADFNGDRLTDFLLYNSTSGTAYQLVNTGADFTYSRADWSPGWTITVLDLNGDARSDLFLYNRTNGLWFTAITSGSGGFDWRTAGRWSEGFTVTTGDFNGDGRSDLFLYHPIAGTWYEVLTTPSLEFQYFGGVMSEGWTVTVDDFNGDRRSDVLLYRPADGLWFKAITTGPGTFDWSTTGRWSEGFAVLAGDFNGDGRADVFLYHPIAGTWWEVLSTPGGTFDYYGAQMSEGWEVSVTDLDGDGRSDVVLYRPADGIWFTALSLGPGSFRWTTGTWGPGWTVFTSR